jgi:hypothetical protein
MAPSLWREDLVSDTGENINTGERLSGPNPCRDKIGRTPSHRRTISKMASAPVRLTPPTVRADPFTEFLCPYDLKLIQFIDATPAAAGVSLGVCSARAARSSATSSGIDSGAFDNAVSFMDILSVIEGVVRRVGRVEEQPATLFAEICIISHELARS